MKTPIEDLIANGENQRVEFKSEVGDGHSVANAVCGMLNSEGGVVIVGVSENHALTGRFLAGDATDLERKLREWISPTAMFMVGIEPIGDKSVICVDVPAGHAKPYGCGTRIYVRLGAQTFIADHNTTSALVSERYASSNRWERRKAMSLAMDDLDAGLIEKTLRMARERGFRFRDPDHIDSCLEDLGLLQAGQLTYAADVLYGKHVATHFPQTRVRALAFANDRASDHIDERLFEGPAPEILERLTEFAQRHIEVAGHFPDGRLERQTRPAVPFAAVREGMVNALVHRDYSAFSGGIALRIYPTKVEIWNSGSFPKDYDVHQLKKPEHPSVLINPDISLVFYLLSLMERTGRGAYTIIQTCVNAGLREPIWEVSASSVLLKMERSPFQLSAEHRKILENLTEGSPIRATDLSMPDRTARRRLSELVDAGYLISEGKGRASRYVRTSKPLDAPND